MEELGELHWNAEIKALNQKANVILRTNTLKTDRIGLQNALSKEDINTKNNS